ncbi:hypothetical protein CH373_05740 [Leptospira perolatii]|uniref:Uncharacterized protein n=1 Tax=Leptospira perolatii TaxID=2023191 RepID=A0A2M9ZQQ8_9LEPT|nr:hypothetical protein [Leptospira perolatii]PJZ70566.1 hypothetical protein CH360_06160 [Leptospira perolatii]PJZ74402.1 hypothetical protein CH373_05740 [Leptospira perolatii]
MLQYFSMVEISNQTVTSGNFVRTVFFPLFVFFWICLEGCFTTSVMSRQYWAGQYAQDTAPFLKEQILEIKEFYLSKNAFVFLVKTGRYNLEQDGIQSFAEKTICIPIRSGDNGFYPRQIELYLRPDSDHCTEVDLTPKLKFELEEIPELSNGIWIRELDLFLTRKSGLISDMNPFPDPDQFGRALYDQRKKVRISPPSLRFLEGKNVTSAFLFYEGYNLHLGLLLDSNQVIRFGNGPRSLYRKADGEPLWLTMDQISKKDLEYLEIRKLQLPKSERTFAVLQEKFDPKSSTWKLESKIYRIKTLPPNYLDGVIFRAEPLNLSRIPKSGGGWYALLYPISVPLDIVTSPLQLISILILGFDGHLWLWNCLLGGSCKTALG